MLSLKIKTQGSPILSQQDLDVYLNSQKQKRVNSSVFIKSHCQSPKSNSSSKEDKSQNDTGTQNLQEQIQRLQDIISLEKDRSDSLTSQNLALVNQLHVQETLISELKIEKDKLIEQIHYIKKGYQQVQEEKNRLLLEAGRYRNQVNCLMGTIDIHEEQISTLEHENKKMLDQLNFQNQMLADYKQENANFKGQLKNMYNAFISMKQMIIEEKQKFINQSKQAIETKIRDLKLQMHDFRDQIQLISSQQKNIDLHKDDVFSLVKRLKLIIDGQRTELNIAKSSNSFEDHQSVGASLFLVRQSQFRKTIQSQEQKIKSLTTQISQLKKKNTQLSDQLSSHNNTQLLSQKYHTNSSYISKLLKQNHNQILQIKQIVDIKQQQISRLKQTLQLQQNTSSLKSQQIQRLHITLKLAQNNPYTSLNNQIEELKMEKLRLERRIEQMGQIEKSLKGEVVEKDRIIMNYVNRSKVK